MKKIYKNSLYMLVAGALVASCADYNVTDNFITEPDPDAAIPYTEYSTIKSYINRSLYPNMNIGTSISASDYKSQDRAHAVAVTNFDNVSLGSGLMSNKFMKENGVRDFTDLQEILTHTKQIDYAIYGSPLASNVNQADGWLSRLTAPIQIYVEYVPGDKIDYNTYAVGTKVGGGTIEKKNGVNALKVNTPPLNSKVKIMEGFDVDPLAKYTFTFTALTEAKGGTAMFNINFCGKKIDPIAGGKYWSFGTGGWRTVVIENIKCPEDATEGYLTIENTPSGVIWVSDVEMGYYPDDHRDQTEQEINDTINYAMNTWCDEFMKYNAGTIRAFDLVEDAIHASKTLEGTEILDLKHSKDKIFWQDIFGSENYAPKVSDAATTAYEKYGGNASDLKFFVAETNLANEQRMNSLKYWMSIWENNGAKIDGINAKIDSLYYSEDPAEFEKNKQKFDNLMLTLAATGKLVRLSNFDIKYQYVEKDEEGNIKLDGNNKPVRNFQTAVELKDEQRQLVADYYAYAIRSYLKNIPAAQQAGISKGTMIDSGENTGLWTIEIESKDWYRTSIYKAFCDALSGK